MVQDKIRPLQFTITNGQTDGNSDNKYNHGNNPEHLYGTYYVPGAILGILQIVTLIIDLVY